MKKAFLFTYVIFLLLSCSKPHEDNKPAPFLSGSGAFIINEGNFRMGNGSLSFYSYDSSKVYNDVFSQVNQRILGDIPNSIRLNGSNVWIVVNNSGKIEIADRNTLMSVKTITGLKSPRHIAFAGNEKVWITSMYSDSLTVLDLRNYNISGYVNIRRTSESIEVIGQEAFVANWIGGNEIMVVNTVTQEITDSITVGMEPESMVVDRNNNLWVLCNGGYSGQYNAELVQLSTATHEIIKRFVFPGVMANPTCLQINGSGDTLYFIQNGIRRMSLTDNSLPSSAFIQPGSHSFYKIGIDPVKGDILVTDALNYQTAGYLLHYHPDGTFMSEYHTDIIPGMMVFKITN